MTRGPRPPLKPGYLGFLDLVKDLRDLFSRTPDQELVEFTGQYISGLTLKLPQIPKAIELVRCVNSRSPGTLTGHGTAVEWTWVLAGARLDRIDGLTVGGTTFDFTFRVSYGAV